ncbi:unnamed protein product, partial [Mesorhabditis spiculigera]
MTQCRHCKEQCRLHNRQPMAENLRQAMAPHLPSRARDQGVQSAQKDVIDELAAKLRNNMRLPEKPEIIELKKLESPTISLNGQIFELQPQVVNWQNREKHDKPTESGAEPIYANPSEDDWRKQVVWRREPKSYRPPPTPEEKLETELRQRRDHQIKVYAKFLKDTVAVHGIKPAVFESCTQMWNTIREELEHRIGLKTTPSRIDEELRLFDEACDALLRVKFSKGML